MSIPDNIKNLLHKENPYTILENKVFPKDNISMMTVCIYLSKTINYKILYKMRNDIKSKKILYINKSKMLNQITFKLEIEDRNPSIAFFGNMMTIRGTKNDNQTIKCINIILDYIDICNIRSNFKLYKKRPIILTIKKSLINIRDNLGFNLCLKKILPFFQKNGFEAELSDLNINIKYRDKDKQNKITILLWATGKCQISGNNIKYMEYVYNLFNKRLASYN